MTPSLTSRLRNSCTHIWHLSKSVETISTENMFLKSFFYFCNESKIFSFALCCGDSPGGGKREGLRVPCAGNNIEHKAAFQGKTQNSFDSDHGHLILNHTFHVLFPHSREKKRKTQEFWGYRDTRRKRNRTLISPSACAQPLQDLSLGKVTLSGKCSTSLSLKIFNCKMGII